MRTPALIPAAAFGPVCLACALMLLCAGAAAQDRPDRGVLDSSIDPFVTTRDSASGLGGMASGEIESADQLNLADRAFLIEAHQIEMLHVHAAAVAMKRRTTQAVESHARRVLESHQPSLVAIEKIGRDQGLELERRFVPEFEQKAEALQQASPSSFGAVFFGQMLELHARTVELYEHAGSTTDNADLHSLVEDSLPTLRTQLADAEQFSTTLDRITVR